MKWNVPPGLREVMRDDGNTLVIVQDVRWGLAGRTGHLGTAVWTYLTKRRLEVVVARDGIQVGHGPRSLPRHLELTGVPGEWLELRADGEALLNLFSAPWGPRSALWISRRIADRLGLRLKEA